MNASRNNPIPLDSVKGKAADERSVTKDKGLTANAGSPRPDAFRLTDFNDVANLPESRTEREALRYALDERLREDFAYRLSLLPEAEQRRLLERETEFNERWDQYIREAAQQYGTKLLFSDLVMDRVWTWSNGTEDLGIRKLKKLLDQMHKSTRIRLGLAKGPITPRHQLAKQFFVPQLTQLQTRLREVWPASAEEVRKFVASEISTSPLLPSLKINARSLLQSLKEDKVAMDFRGQPEHSTGDITPTQFFVNWVATSERRSPEAVRQDLTKKARS